VVQLSASARNCWLGSEQHCSLAMLWVTARVLRHAAAVLAFLLVLLPLCEADEGGALQLLEEPQPASSLGRDTANGELGKGSMSELLAWAVKNGDPDKLKEVVKRFKESNLTVEDYYGKDVVDALLRDEGKAMRDIISKVADHRNVSRSDDELEVSLYDLQELIEQVDHAGNLHRMNGMLPLLDIGLGTSRGSSTRSLALWTLGIAAQNNEPVQNDLLELDGLQLLIGRLPLCQVATEGPLPEPVETFEYCGKLVFAISGLVRNNATTLASADKLGLFDWLLDVGMRHVVPSVAKKALGLLDTALAQKPDLPILERMGTRQVSLTEEVLKRLQDTAWDVDLVDKVFRFLNRLLSLRPFLFNDDFRENLAAAAEGAVERCETTTGDEICKGLSGFARHADVMLAARDVSDEEL